MLLTHFILDATAGVPLVEQKPQQGGANVFRRLRDRYFIYLYLHRVGFRLGWILQIPP